MVTGVSSVVPTWSSPAMGGWLVTVTVTVVDAVSVAPSWSVTVSATACDPAVSKVKVGVADVEVPAAPASHAYVSRSPSASSDAVAENRTVRGASPVTGSSAAIDATGGEFSKSAV